MIRTHFNGTTSACLCIIVVIFHIHGSSCDYDSSELFRTVHFEVEEGTLLSYHKIIGNITLENIVSNFRYEEPYFKKPQNIKTKPQRPYFEIKFFNHTSIPTTKTPRFARDADSFTDNYDETLPFNTSVHPTDGVLFESSGDDIRMTSVMNNISVYSSVPTPITAHHVANATTRTDENAATDTTSLIYPTTVTGNPGRATETSTSHTQDISAIAQVIQIFDLDREKTDTHYLTINTENNGILIDFPVIVVIKVTDINDNSPVFVNESLHSEIANYTQAGDVIAKVEATDADEGLNADLRYSILPYSIRLDDAKESPDLTFITVHDKLGFVFLLVSLEDMDSPKKIVFQVVVKDAGDNQVANRATATATVSISHSEAPPQPLGMSTGVIIALCVIGGVTVVAVLIVVVLRYRKRRALGRDGQLAFMLDDDNMVVG